MNFDECTHANESVEEYLQHLQDKTNLTMIPAVTMMGIFAVTGLIGNILVLVVYSKKFTLNPTKVLIMTIASFDLVANVGAIPSEANIMFDSWNFSNPAVCKSKVFLGAFTIVGGAISLMAVAVVRYRKVCHPHEWQVTIKQAIFASIGAASISFLVSIPYIIIYGVKTKETPCDHIKGYECFADDYYFYTIWPLMNNLLFIFLYFCLSSSMVVLYILIGVTAWKQSKQRRLFMKRSNPKSTTDSTNTGLPEDTESKSSRFQSQPSLNIHVSVKDLQQLVMKGARKDRLRLLFCCMRQRERSCSSCTSQTLVVINSHSSTMDGDTTEPSSSKECNVHDTCSEEISSTGEIKHNMTNSDDTGLKVPSLEGNNQENNTNTADNTESPCHVSDISNVLIYKPADEIHGNIYDSKDQPDTTRYVNTAQNAHVSNVDRKTTQNKIETLSTSHYDENVKTAEKRKKDGSIEYLNAKQTTHKRKSKSISLRNNVKWTRNKSLSRMTLMLIIISATYVFPFIPFLGLTIIKNRRPDIYNNLTMAELTVFNLFYRLYFVNTAANPIIYSLCNIKFRRACMRLFTCTWRRRP